MNARKHRQMYQAKGTDRLEPKGKQPGVGSGQWPTANHVLPVYRADLNHPVNAAEHGNVASLPGLATGRTYRKAGSEAATLG